MADKNIERGDRIRLLRERENLSQDELAEKVGASDGSHVSKWEAGKGISRKYLVKLAKALNTSISFIEDGERTKDPIKRKISALEQKVNDEGADYDAQAQLLEYLQGRTESLSQELAEISGMMKNLRASMRKNRSDD